MGVAGGANYLVTGNLKHFPVRTRHGLVVVFSRSFLMLASLAEPLWPITTLLAAACSSP